MGRRDYDYISQRDFTGGVNYEPDKARAGQLLDVQNMWVPEGRLAQRPGYIGVWVSVAYPTPDNPTMIFIKEDVSTSTFTAAVNPSTLTLSSLEAQGSTHPAGGRWYIGLTSITDVKGVSVTITLSNGSSVRYKSEYWNGENWTDFKVFESYTDQPGAIFPHLGQSISAEHLFRFVQPADWATTTVTASSVAYTKYFIRFLLVEAVAASLDANVVIDNGNGADPYLITDSGPFVGAALCQFATQKRFVLLTNVDSDTTAYAWLTSLQDGTPIPETGIAPRPTVYTTTTGSSFPASIATVPVWNEVYIAHDGYFRAISINSSSTDIQAYVEDRSEIVGTVGTIKSKYHPDRVAQLTSVPSPRYIMWFDGKLWVANLDENPWGVRWSAREYTLSNGTPQPAHRVWPASSFTTLIEEDNSHITGMSNLDEHVIVFKQDSIWRMVFEATDEVGIELYAAIKIVSGIGCVSNASIARTPLGLMFLSEDGVYLFNGVTAKKISVNIDPLMATMNKSRRSWAAGVCWRTEQCYLLALALDGSDSNNYVLVFDYAHPSQDETGEWVPSIWVWNNIEAQVWMSSESESDDEELYFGDASGHLYQLGVGNLDNGAAIESYFQAQRIGYGDYIVKTARDIMVEGTQEMASATVEVKAEDEDISTSGAIDFSHENDVTLAEMLVDGEVLSTVKRRERHIGIRETGRWFTVKVSHSGKGATMKVAGFSLGLVQRGRW